MVSQQLSESHLKNPSGRKWKAVCLVNAQDKKLLLWILLDNQSTADLFGYKCLLKNIREVDDSMTMTTNGGELTTNVKGHLPGYGDAWCHPDAMANMLSLSNVAKKCRVTFDSTEDSVFCVHTPDHIVRFQCSDKGLFYHDAQECDLMLLNAADENKANCIKR